MQPTWIKRGKYQNAGEQIDKDTTIQIAEKTVDNALALLEDTDEFSKISKYKPTDKILYIGGAPIILIKINNRVIKAIAPDIYGELKNGKKIWIEVKDKSQRAFYPDTGCDVHQFIGFWNINYYLNEPVLMMFIDPSIENIRISTKLNERQKIDYIQRLKKFQMGNDPCYYGNWLAILSKYNKYTKYPLCSHERSRTMSRSIVYFEISKMKRLGSSGEIKTMLRETLDDMERPTFHVFDRNNNKVISDISFYSSGGY